MPGPDRHQAEVAGDEAVGDAADLDRELAAEDVQRLLERVDVAPQPAAGRERADRELGVDGALVPAHQHLAGEAAGRGGGGDGPVREGPVDPTDVIHAGTP